MTSSFDSSDKKLLFQCHKETQTNFKNSSTTSEPNTSDEGSITVLEFNEILQDPTHPEDITIIKDVFSEEIHDHGSQTSGSDNAKSNRYKYCREVIKPFLKDYPMDCPVSDEQIIRDALLAAYSDYPDNQPCFETYDSGIDINSKKDSDKSDKDLNNQNSQSSNLDEKQSSKTCSPKDTDKLDNDLNKPNSQPSINTEEKQYSKTCTPKDTCKLDKDLNILKSQLTNITDEKQSSKTCTTKTKNNSGSSSTDIVGSSIPLPTGTIKSESSDIKSESSDTSTVGKTKKSKKCKNRRKKVRKSDSSESNIKDSNCNKTKAIVTEKPSKDSLHSNMSDDEECPLKKRDPKCPKKTKRPSIENEVFKTGTRPPAGPPSACKKPATAGVSTCKNTPSAETCKDKKDDEEGSSSKKKKKDENPCKHKMASIASSLKPSINSLDSTSLDSKRPKSIADAHSETMATIKLAVEDFFGKLCQTTKDAVNVIRKESARHICNLACERSESKGEFKPRKVSDDQNEKNPDTDKFKLFRDSGASLSDTVQAVAGNILNKVDSTFSLLSNHVDVTMRSMTERSSPYDETIEEAAAVSNSNTTGVNSVFTSIKSKIISMFSESNSKEVAPRSANESPGVNLNEKRINRPK